MKIENDYFVNEKDSNSVSTLGQVRQVGRQPCGGQTCPIMVFGIGVILNMTPDSENQYHFEVQSIPESIPLRGPINT